MVTKLLIGIVAAVVIVSGIGGFVYLSQQQHQKVVESTQYVITINEVGLPSGMSWTVSISNQPTVTVNAGKTTSFDLVDGTYQLYASAEYTTYATSSPETVTVSNSTQTVAVYFSAVSQSIVAVNVLFNYRGSTSGYFGSSTQSFSGGYYDAGNTITEVFTLQSSALLFNHNISAVTSTTQGFQVKSVSPQLPVTISPGGSVTITITISTPLTTYNGVLSLTLTTY